VATGTESLPLPPVCSFIEICLVVLEMKEED